jgi:hypothetical protein
VARRYLIKAGALSAILLCLHFVIIGFVRGPIAAAYWLRDAIVIKRYLAGRMTSPKIIFLGGSNALFGIDARQVEQALGIPSINYGLHGCLHFDVLAAEAEQVAKSGDILVMPIEQANYSEGRFIWTDCQLRNAIAWGGDYIDKLSLRDRLKFIYVAGQPSLSLEILAAKIGSLVAPAAYAQRLDAMLPPDQIVARFGSGTFRRAKFGYSAYNLSDHGDMTLNAGSRYAGPGVPVMAPGAIFPGTKTRLARFVAEMKGRGVRVIIAHAPYLIDGKAPSRWQVAEADFAADVKDIGAEVLDRRDELFFPRAYFFDTLEHLNEAGRRIRTQRVIANLRRLGIGAPAEATVTSAGGRPRGGRSGRLCGARVAVPCSADPSERRLTPPVDFANFPPRDRSPRALSGSKRKCRLHSIG